MSRLVALDRREQLNGDLDVTEACCCEVRRYEFSQSLGVELGLQLLQHIGELCIVMSVTV